MNKIWINVEEKTHRFLGAYSSKDLAFSAMQYAIDQATDPDFVALTIEYPLVSGKIDKQQITVEDILNGQN